MDISKVIAAVIEGKATLANALEAAYLEGQGMAVPRPASEYHIVRTYSSGVFCGVIESRNGKEVVLNDARRLWYWKGAASLSQLAVEGVSYPNECKFPEAVNGVILLEAIEILPVTVKAKASIDSVPVWKA